MYWGLLLLSPALGLSLSEIENLKLYKFLYVIGIAWSILGVITLSYLGAASERFKKVALRISAYVFNWLFMIVPFGLLLGAFAGGVFGNPSSEETLKLGGYLGFAGMASMFFFEDFVEYPKFRFAHTTNQRIGFMGGYFVMVGLVFQFVASVFDLVGFNG
jgi:hypothetical protein